MEQEKSAHDFSPVKDAPPKQLSPQNRSSTKINLALNGVNGTGEVSHGTGGVRRKKRPDAAGHPAWEAIVRVERHGESCRRR
jgi:hypothetical protein